MAKGAPDFALLIGKPKGKGEGKPIPSDDPSGDEGSMDKSGAELSAARDALSAVHLRDPESFLSAIKDLVEICYPQLSDSDAEESPEADEGIEPASEDGE